MENIYDKLGKERKLAQEEGKYPEWFTTGAYQMFKESYECQADGFKEQLGRIANTLAEYAVPFLPKEHPYYQRIVENHGNNWKDCFFDIMWKNEFAPSTPVLANTGTDRGCSVSCSGQYVGDSVLDFYDAAKESALLTKEGFGTSAYLGDIRPRGSVISKGGKADGTMPVKSLLQKTAKDISQAGVRRGAIACYLPIDHDDFYEWCEDLRKNPQGQNIGWIISDNFIERLQNNDEEAHKRFAKTLVTKCQTGKGYYWKADAVQRQQTKAYLNNGLNNKASNLCTEITLHSDEDHSYTCIISSMVATTFRVWKTTGSVFIAIVFLDALCNEFIAKASTIKGLEKAVRYTKKAKSLGLGLLGLHSWFQEEMVAFESFEAHMMNVDLFSHIQEESLAASKYIAEVTGEPEWCKGTGYAHTHLTACAPNVSSAVLAGQLSQGIEPWLANAFLQPTAAGEMMRINPTFLNLAKEKGKYTKALITDIVNHKGSVQHLTWLSDHEKAVFKTAFEIDQKAILRLASTRQRYIDQGISLNLFFDADEDEAYIAEVHKEFLLDPYLKGLYYLRSESGIQASKNTCLACES